jgi:phytoene dehydrogenase-like protein
MAQHGKSVVVYEAQENIGGGARSAEMTLPGFIHDVCSSVYPLAIGSPFFRSLPLAQHGLEWIQPPAAVAHPFDDGTAVTQERSVEATAAQLGFDEKSYRSSWLPGRGLEWLGRRSSGSHTPSAASMELGAVRPTRHPTRAAPGCKSLSRRTGQRTFCRLGGSLYVPLEHWGSAAFGLVLGIAGHSVGWPIARGGAQKLSDALVAHLRSLGGEIIPNRPVRSLSELPASRVVLCDLTPRQVLEIAGEHFSPRYRESLRRYRYGMGALRWIGRFQARCLGQPPNANAQRPSTSAGY